QSYAALETQTNDTVEEFQANEQALKEKLAHEKQRCRTYKDQVTYLNEEILLLRDQDNSDLRCRLDQYQQLVEEADRILVHLRGLVTSLSQKLEKTKTKQREEREQRLNEIKALEEQVPIRGHFIYR
ncbi:unnamed protein product, partial [Dibothriocephalus latus]